MYIEKFDCEFVDLVALYRASDRNCPPSPWATSTVGLDGLLATANDMGCRICDIYIPKGRGRSATCWVHPRVVPLWQDWAQARQLKHLPVERQQPPIIPEVVEDTPWGEEDEVSDWNSENLEILDPEALLMSDTPFPVDFENAWRWAGYSRKDSAKRLFTSKNSPLKEGTDFSTVRWESPGGRPAERIFLTVDCFEHFCLMARTGQGREIRDHFIKCRRELMRLKSQPQQPLIQETNADPFIQMIEQDLRRSGVDEALISGWKYDALKAFHPDQAGLLEQAKSLILYSAVQEESPVNVTAISNLLAKRHRILITPEYLNKIWVEMGFQDRGNTSACHWVRTDKGAKYNKLVPFVKPEKQGFQLLWYPSVINPTFEYLRTKKHQ